jgi:hypothetical protein
MVARIETSAAAVRFTAGNLAQTAAAPRRDTVTSRLGKPFPGAFSQIGGDQAVKIL